MEWTVLVTMIGVRFIDGKAHRVAILVSGHGWATSRAWRRAMRRR